RSHAELSAEGCRAGRRGELRSGDCRRMPPHLRLLVRACHEGGEGPICSWAHRNSAAPRWAPSDHLHAMWADTLPGLEYAGTDARTSRRDPAAHWILDAGGCDRHSIAFRCIGTIG